MKLCKWERFFIYPILGILLIVFAFYDLDIMKSLYDPTNMVGRIGELIGEMPTQLLGVYASLLLFRFRDKSTKARNIIYGIVFMVLAVFFAGYGGGQIWKYLQNDTYGFGNHVWILFPIAAAYLLVGGLLAFLPKYQHQEKIVAFGLFFIAMYVGIIILMNVFKFIWYRPRWRYLYPLYGDEASSYFAPWYLPNCHWKFSDSYASFPSGHTMNALTVIVASLIPSFVDKLKGKEWCFRLFAYLWAIYVAISRTIMGAHFPSDTTAGFLIALVFFDLMVTFFYPFIEKKLNKKGIESPIENPQ